MLLTWVQGEHFSELLHCRPFSTECLEKTEPTCDRGNLLPWHLSVKTHKISRGTGVKIKCFLTEGAKKEYDTPACEKRRSRNDRVPGSTGGQKLAGLHDKPCKWPILRNALSTWAGLHARFLIPSHNSGCRISTHPRHPEFLLCLRTHADDSHLPTVPPPAHTDPACT